MGEALTLPDGVEIARAQDEAELIELLKLKHEEDGGTSVFPLDNLQGLVRRGIRQDRGYIGVIRSNKRRNIVATVGLFLESTIWHVTSDLHLLDHWLFIHPAHRRGTEHIKNLFTFSKWASSKCGRPVVLVHVDNDLTRLKGGAYERAFEGAYGRIYVFDPTGDVGARRAERMGHSNINGAEDVLYKMSKHQIQALFDGGIITGPIALAALTRTR